MDLLIGEFIPVALFFNNPLWKHVRNINQQRRFRNELIRSGSSPPFIALTNAIISGLSVQLFPVLIVHHSPVYGV
jgi:hypothetical protein